MQSFGFKEGIVVVDKSRVAIFQYPAPKDNPKEQSDAFTCVIWDVTKLDKDLNIIQLAENEQPTRIISRLCKPESGRPGQLKEKDFDDMDVTPKDLGSEVGTEGNCLFLEDGQKVEGSGWSKLEESLTEACGFKQAVVARGIATDYEGMIVHLKTIEGDKYTAKRGKNAGKEVPSYHLVADKVYRFPYDKNSKVKVGGEPASTKSKANGKDEEGTKGKGGEADGGGGDSDEAKLVAAANAVLEKASAKFKAQFYTGKPTDKKKFTSELVKELWKQQVEDKLQEEIMEFVKTDDGLKAVAAEFGFKVKDDSVVFPEAD
jgi:hypothetical protein